MLKSNKKIIETNQNRNSNQTAERVVDKVEDTMEEDIAKDVDFRFRFIPFGLQTIKTQNKNQQNK